jgi:general secretion pathway protein K
LQDVFKDFEDVDNLRRLNGAEADDYRLQKLPEPRNAQMVTLTEVQGMPGWNETPALWKIDGLLDHATVGKGEQLNLQTATWRTLVTMAGVDAATARDLVARREAGEPLTNDLLYSLSTQAGGQGAAVDIGGRTSNLVSETVIITLQPSKAAWALRLTVLHTPVSDLAPWRIVASQVIERNPIENNNKLPLLPELDPVVDARYRERAPLPF